MAVRHRAHRGDLGPGEIVDMTIQQGDTMRIRHLILTVASSLGLTLGLLVILGGQARPVQADPTTRYVSPAGSDAGDCTMAACLTIQYAIDQSGNSDTLIVAAGTYTENLYITNITLTVRGAGAASTFIDGGGVDSTVEVWNTAVVTITGATIQNGRVNWYGGGLAVQNGAMVTLDRVTVLSNTAGDSGGGVCVVNGAAILVNSTVISNAARLGAGVNNMSSGNTIVLNGATVSGNTSAASGGGVYNNGTLTITGGAITGNMTPGVGGGVANEAGVATLAAVTIMSNTANSGGGLNNQATGQVTVLDAVISGNVVTYTGGGIQSLGALTLTNVTIRENLAGSDGGGLSVRSGRTELIGGQILSNTAANVGGGVYVGDNTSARFTQSGPSLWAHNSAYDGAGLFISYGQAALDGGQISRNVASHSGGGVYVRWNTAVLTQTGNSLISDNVANGAASDEGGGGLYVYNGRATLSGVGVLSNTAAKFGGGLYVADGTLAVVNATVSHNAVTDTASGGGGLYVVGGATMLTYTTFVGNTAVRNAGGIYRTVGNVGLWNTLLAGNGPANCQGALTSGGYNLDSGDTCGLTATGDLTNTNPLLGPVGDNGGGTLTHALLAGSPAIDAGDCISGVSLDQRGVVRPADGDGDGTPACDMGAFEFTWRAIYLPVVMRN